MSSKKKTSLTKLNYSVSDLPSIVLTQSMQNNYLDLQWQLYKDHSNVFPYMPHNDNGSLFYPGNLPLHHNRINWHKRYSTEEISSLSPIDLYINRHKLTYRSPLRMYLLIEYLNYHCNAPIWFNQDNEERKTYLRRLKILAFHMKNYEDVKHFLECYNKFGIHPL